MGIDRLHGSGIRLPSEFDPRERLTELKGPANTERVAFKEALGEVVGDVNALQHEAAGKVEAFVRGDDVPLHEVVLAQEEAELSFRLLLEVRDQVVKAYQEIIRTPM